MDPVAFFERSKVLFVAGKGGVGKSTTTAVVALAAARCGLRVLAVELEGRGELPRALGLDGVLDWEERLAVAYPAGGSVTARRIRPDDALVEWLRAHTLGAVVRRLRRSGALDVVSFAIPGIREVLVLGKLKAVERGGEFDLVVVDAPATGHAITLLTSPAGLATAARGGPVRRQAEEVAALLADPARCRVLLVTLPRELAVDETIEAAYEVEDRAGVTLSVVVVNQYVPPGPALEAPLGTDDAAALGPPLAAAVESARRFERSRELSAAAEVHRLAASLPLRVLALPPLDTDRLGPAEADLLADALLGAVQAIEGHE
ncbi:MAG TPA: ArsA-related P-loop ATPase [Acidimicrobiales bacterium]|nr:ArsA-related P-loop ATPase [Acidimicrobiales bacterium]